MIKGSLWALLAVLLMAGCHGDSDSTAQATFSKPSKKGPPPVRRGPSPEELTAGMVEAVPLGKTTVPVGVKFDLPARPTVGRPIDVVIALLPQVIGSATLQVTATEGLQLAPEAATINIPSIEPTQAYRVSIATTPTHEGVEVLSVNVSVSHDDATEARTFSVPVIVGPPEALAAGTH